MNHPDTNRLALLAGGDLGFWPGLSLRLHVRGCARCQSELRTFHRTRQVVSDAAKDLPPGLDWSRLAEEMTGNIRVGLAAGECVGGGYPPRPRFFPLRWNGAMAAALLTGIFVLGFWLNMPAPRLEHLWSSLRRVHGSAAAPADVLVASQQGIEIKGNNTSFSYVPPENGAVVISVSAQGSAAARAMDDDTGQTTITEVYDAR